MHTHNKGDIPSKTIEKRKHSGNYCSKTIRHKELQIILAKYLSIENERFREQINLV